ncbi:hypothetical protein K493DRAFT_78569 [Basidiobolus meristosporus CBS 931.73]|uniref:Uncharacterized protein n=1 Tax=Basidiobolus meristosporus CBS 931.73 TaxID=1314790 RepID=A0A1Y1XRQ6_9FUNG|nr:hypothetical protein K493DRAFT_78569 [Basidiobolus meristosporus CBS 931.73]|eukprot:ORX88442.1 hypothetical protein K493DRAFT_78569 [Basidiobolus meristosporus CBS 931.73]
MLSAFVVTVPFQVDDSKEDSFYKFSLQTGLKEGSEVLGVAECRKDQLLLCCETGVPGTLTIDLRYMISEQLLADKKVGSITIFMENIPRLPRSTGLPLLRHFSPPIQQTYRLVNDQQIRLRVNEVLSESPFISSLPCKLLGLFIVEERDIIQKLESLDFAYSANTDLNVDFMKGLQSTQIDRHRDMLEYYADTFHELNHKQQSKIHAGEGEFRRSPEKKDEELQWLPLNCCVQQLQVEEIEQAKFSSYSFVTFGAPCAHSILYRGKAELSLGDVDQSSYCTGYLDNTIDHLKSDVENLTQALERCIQGILEEAQSGSVENLGFKKQLSEFRFLVNELRQFTLNFLDTTILQEGSTSKEPAVTSICEEVDLITYQLNEESFSNLMELIDSKSPMQLDECLAQISSYNINAQKRLLALIDYHMLSVDRQHTENTTLRRRDDIALSQAITALASGFVCMIDECLETLNPFKSSKHHFLWTLFWERLEKVGFLCQFESLLSAYGYEYNMLLDTYKTLREIGHSVRIGLHAVPEDFKIDQALDVFGHHGSIVISVGIPEVYFAKINPSLQNGGRIPVVPIVFTQGINEQQAYANMMGDLKFQDQINAESYDQYCHYLAKYQRWWQLQSVPGDYAGYWKQLDQLMDRLKAEIDHVSQSFLKGAWRIKATLSPMILQLASEITLLIGSYPQSTPTQTDDQQLLAFMLPRCSMRYIMCKSAKDRTSMAVTLEQARILKKMHHLSDQYYDKILKAMREECGVRIANIERNLKLGLWEDNEDHSSTSTRLTLQAMPSLSTTSEFSDPRRGEKGKYAFNFWQLYFFPEEYRPASRVIGNFSS